MTKTDDQESVHDGSPPPEKRGRQSTKRTPQKASEATEPQNSTVDGVLKVVRGLIRSPVKTDTQASQSTESDSAEVDEASGSEEKESAETPAQPADEVLEYEVEAILNSRLNRRRKNRFEYEVRWVGYTSAQNTWEPPEHLENATDLVSEFHKKNPDKPKPKAPEGKRLPDTKSI